MSGYVQAAKGMTLYRYQRRAEAVEALEHAYANWTATLGPGHIRTLRLGYNVAVLQSGLEGRKERSITLLRDVVRESERSLAPGRSAANLFRIALGQRLAEAGRWQELLSVLTTPHALGADLDDSIGNLSDLRALAGRVVEAACPQPPPERKQPCSALNALMARLEARLAELGPRRSD
jgi:hypothetical protein